jgi:cell wall assembly regulator SMI1
LRDLWTKIERWVDGQAALPPADEVFAPPASVVEIERAEAAFECRFPPSMRESLLVHNGQATNIGYGWLPGQMDLLSLDQIVEQWRLERGAEAEVADPDLAEETTATDRVRGFPAVTHRGRIPVAQGIGSAMYVDLVPGPAGVPGQVIVPDNEVEFFVVGRDLRDFFTRYLDLLAKGLYRYDADTRASVVPTDPRWRTRDLLEIPANEPLRTRWRESRQVVPFSRSLTKVLRNLPFGSSRSARSRKSPRRG